MKLSVMRERHPGETRVALTPANISTLTNLGCEVFVETGAGDAAGFSNDSYREAGAVILETRSQLLAQGEIILCVDASLLNALGVLLARASPAVDWGYRLFRN